MLSRRRRRAAARSSGGAEPVEVDVEEAAHLAQWAYVVSGNGVNMVRAVATEDLLSSCVEASERVGPDVCRRAHQPLVRLCVELLERAGHHLHPVSPVQPREASERKGAGRSEVVNRSAPGREIEVL